MISPTFFPRTAIPIGEEEEIVFFWYGFADLTRWNFKQSLELARKIVLPATAVFI